MPKGYDPKLQFILPDGSLQVWLCVSVPEQRLLYTCQSCASPIHLSVCPLQPKWICWVILASISKLPSPAACVCQACRINWSSGCLGICCLLGQIFDFWFLPPVRLPVAQTAGISDGHLGGVSAFSLLAALAMTLGRSLTGSGASFSPLWLTGCALAPCWEHQAA